MAEFSTKLEGENIHRISANAHLQCAQAWSILGNERKARQYLDTAEELLDGAGHLSSNPLGISASFMRARHLQAQKGIALLRLGRFEESINNTSAAMDGWGEDFGHEGGFHLSYLALAYARKGECDISLQHAMSALEIANKAGAGRGIEILEEVGSTLIGRGYSSPVMDAFTRRLKADQDAGSRS
ncbi:hypothetical protein [Streptomyces sp. NPDC058874]|uniref:hypothetical protein n=1 Tax=unclassified Streptomyces TaxID=2593676 RepID=UPI0036B364D0